MDFQHLILIATKLVLYLKVREVRQDLFQIDDLATWHVGVANTVAKGRPPIAFQCDIPFAQPEFADLAKISALKFCLILFEAPCQSRLHATDQRGDYDRYCLAIHTGGEESRAIVAMISMSAELKPGEKRGTDGYSAARSERSSCGECLE